MVIRMEKNRESILRNYEIYQLTESNGYVEATINMSKYEYAMEDILAIISFVEILHPIELRTYAEEILNNLVKIYNS